MIKVWRKKSIGACFPSYRERFYAPEVEKVPEMGETFDGKIITMCERCSPEAEPGYYIYQIALTAEKDLKRRKKGDYSVEEVFYIAIKMDSES